MKQNDRISRVTNLSNIGENLSIKLKKFWSLWLLLGRLFGRVQAFMLLTLLYVIAFPVLHIVFKVYYLKGKRKVTNTFVNVESLDRESINSGRKQ